MNRNCVRLVPLILAFAMTGSAMGRAQTRWVHINHARAGNIIITPVDLNSGSKADLARLPGIGEADAQRIIDGRPYEATNELVGKRILSAAAYAKIKGRVIALFSRRRPRY